MFSELGLGGLGTAVSPAPPPPRERDLPRAWVWLALLLLGAAPMAAPYTAAFAGRDPAFDWTARTSVVTLANIVQALIVSWPLAYLGLRLAHGLGWGAPFLDGTRPWREVALPLAFAASLGVCTAAFTDLATIGAFGLWPRAFAAPHAVHVHIAPWKGLLVGPAAGIEEETQPWSSPATTSTPPCGEEP